MSNYRIRVLTPSGIEVMKIPFDQKPDQDAYWSKLVTAEGLEVFVTWGSVVLMKEYMTQGGNWESEMITPVKVGQ